jgi:malate dehydrogenase
MLNKVSIVGSGGVGSNAAFSLLHRFPPKELVLIDINPGLAQGTALDLQDTRDFLDFSTKITASQKLSSLKNSDIVVVTAGIARKKGMTRLDLLKTNAAIVKDIAANIKKYAPASIVIAVTNPLDMITYVIAKETGFNRKRVIGMGSSLDTSRLFNTIYSLSNLSVSSLAGFVFGEHSKEMIVNLSRLSVEGEPLKNILAKNKLSGIKQKVQLRGAEIVACLKAKSATFAPGAACASLIGAIAADSRKIIPVSVLLRGEYGLNDICLGVPCVIGAGGVVDIIEICLTKAEKKELLKSKELFKQCMI